MSPEFQIILYLLLVLFLLVFFVLYLFRRIRLLKERVERLDSGKRSGEVKHGKAWEQFVPFLADFPYEKERFRFLGEPIDGIVFGDDKISFIEIKTGSSKLSPRQKRLKEIIEKKEIEFRELRY